MMIDADGQRLAVLLRFGGQLPPPNPMQQGTCPPASSSVTPSLIRTCAPSWACCLPMRWQWQGMPWRSASGTRWAGGLSQGLLQQGGVGRWAVT